MTATTTTRPTSVRRMPPPPVEPGASRWADPRSIGVDSPLPAASAGTACRSASACTAHAAKSWGRIMTGVPEGLAGPRRDAEADARRVVLTRAARDRQALDRLEERARERHRAEAAR